MRKKGRRDGGTKGRRAAGGGPPVDKYTCYELCVQDAARLVPFLEAVHGGRPRVLREDFCGTAGVARAWAASSPQRRAVAVDQSAGPLRRARAERVRAVRAEVMGCGARADIITATNFPVGYWHTRPALVRYLERCRARLNPRGVFVCDTYGGATAFTIGTMSRDIRAPGGLRIHYLWEQREADPTTGMVLDTIHFRADRDGEIVYQEADAFVYRWRLWSVPELRDAMAEAGFRKTEVYADLGGAVDQHGKMYVRPVGDPADLGESFVVCVAGRA
ncbi:MAG: hypothetical protein WD749_07720 [Phycisphaerales bacterium]